MSEEAPDQLWVLDTSAVLAIKHRIQVSHRKQHLKQLEDFVNDGFVVCPPKVISELGNYSNDMYNAWAKRVKSKACRYGQCAEQMQRAMSERTVAQCIEHLETKKDLDPADPWVIAHCLHLRDELEVGVVTVVTEERDRFKGARTSLNIAAGAFGFPAINYETLVSQKGAWDDSHLL